MLSPNDIQRYARQILLPQVGKLGQQRLLATRVIARGQGPELEAAIAWVSAAGVTVSRQSPEAPAEIDGRRLAACGFVDRRLACEACQEAFLASLASESNAAAAEPGGPVSQRAVSDAVGAAAASEVILGAIDGGRAPLALRFCPEPARALVVRKDCGCRV